MKIIKAIIGFFKRLFSAKPKTETERKSRVKKQTPSVRLTNKQKRDAWLSSTGYTPRQVRRSTKVQLPKISHYASMVLAYRRAKRKGIAKVYDNGETGLKKKLIRNKQGIPFFEIKKVVAFN